MSGRANVIRAPLRTKVITATRDMTAASGAVSYTGVGFKPKAIIAMGFIASSDANAAIGFGDSALVDDAMFWNTTPSVGNSNSLLMIQTNPGVAYQAAVITSYDTDGFTLTWTKTSTPTGTATLKFLCIG